MSEHSESKSSDSSSEEGLVDDYADLDDFIDDDDGDIDVSVNNLFVQLVDTTCIDMLLTGKTLRGGEFVIDASASVIDPFLPGPYMTWQKNLSAWEDTPEGQISVEKEGENVDAIFYRETQAWLRQLDEKLEAACAIHPYDIGRAITVLRHAKRWEPAENGQINVDGRLVALPQDFPLQPAHIQHIWLLCNLPYAMKRAAYFWFKDNASRLDGVYIGDCLAFIRKNYVVEVGEQLKRDYDEAERWLDAVFD